MDLKLGHYAKDGIEVIDVEGEIDIYTAPRLRDLLIDLVSKNNYQLVVNLDKVGFLDSTGLGVLVGGLKRVRAHDGSLDLVCTQQRILKIFKITGLTKVFGIYETVDQAIAAKGRRLGERDKLGEATLRAPRDPVPGPGHLVCRAGVYPNPTARQAQTVSLPKVCRSPGRVPLGHHFNARQAAIVFELGFVP